MLAFIAPCEFQIAGRSLPRFLDETVEENHSALFVDIEKYPCGAALRYVCSHFVNSGTERLADRHPYRPAVLYGLDVFADPFPVLGGERLQPLAHGFSSSFGAIENCRDTFARQTGSMSLRPVIAIFVLYHRWYVKDFSSLAAMIPQGGPRCVGLVVEDGELSRDSV